MNDSLYMGEYYYLKNAFGDITAIYNTSNTLQARYTYDAWGNCTVQNIVGTVGNENPFRYRGYFWDKDLLLYYCQSKYYDPQIGRWISPDTLEYLEPSQLNGLNLYAYCYNNPVMYCDPSGHSWWDDWGKKALGWLAVTVLAAGAFVMIGFVAIGTVATTTLAASVMVGAGVEILAGVGGSIAAQGGFANITNINPWSAAIAGVIGGVIGQPVGQFHSDLHR